MRKYKAYAAVKSFAWVDKYSGDIHYAKWNVDMTELIPYDAINLADGRYQCMPSGNKASYAGDFLSLGKLSEDSMRHNGIWYYSWYDKPSLMLFDNHSESNQNDKEDANDFFRRFWRALLENPDEVRHEFQAYADKRAEMAIERWCAENGYELV